MKWIASKAGFDEVFGRPSAPRTHYAALISILKSFTLEDVTRRERLQGLALSRARWACRASPQQQRGEPA
jgi:hypothetical protein